MAVGGVFLSCCGRCSMMLKACPFVRAASLVSVMTSRVQRRSNFHARHKTFWRFCVLQPEVVNPSRTRQPGRCRQQAQAGGLSGACATLTLFVHCCASIVLTLEVVTRADVTAHPSTFTFACNSRNSAMSDEFLDLADMLSILSFSAMGLRTNLPPQHQIS